MKRRGENVGIGPNKLKNSHAPMLNKRTQDTRGCNTKNCQTSSSNLSDKKCVNCLNCKCKKNCNCSC